MHFHSPEVTHNEYRFKLEHAQEEEKLSRYDMLVRVLDGIRAEAPDTKLNKRYAKLSAATQEIWQARSRAYIHLYLKVMFGLSDFLERESYITDGVGDGGIDGYYIDSASKRIILIQSKFRNSETNFESKPIEFEEILSMQIRRVLGGENSDISGIEYNGKIKAMQRSVSEITDLGRYSYLVIILANLREVSSLILQKLTDGYHCEVFDFKRSYKELLYPVLSGNLYKASELNITLDISNKSLGAKISYSMTTHGFQCDIAIVFVPTIEIARIMLKYKNSILRFNPRSYLEFKGQNVNIEIKNTLMSGNSSDFALMNNGITVICDEIGVNEQSGRKHKAQLFLSNPQIINGGQTAYTLSRVYEYLTDEERGKVFSGKEVLLRVIALDKEGGNIQNHEDREALIQKISRAVNSQMAVTTADRESDRQYHHVIQNELFQKFGILYERKVGEFGDGLIAGYIQPQDVISRVAFARLYFTSLGLIREALGRHVIRALGEKFSETNQIDLDRVAFAYYVSQFVKADSLENRKKSRTVLAKVYAAMVAGEKFEPPDKKQKAKEAVEYVQENWTKFLYYVASTGSEYANLSFNTSSKIVHLDIVNSQRAFGKRFIEDVERFF
jgi:hypothetical protein